MHVLSSKGTTVYSDKNVCVQNTKKQGKIYFEWVDNAILILAAQR